MIRLYHTPACPFCHRVRIMLSEKELDYQSVPLDLEKEENRTDSFLRLNPLGKIPVLTDDDLILSESFVINEYLNEEYPYPELMPSDPQSRASARLWCFQIEHLVAGSFIEYYLSDNARKKGESFEEARLSLAHGKIVKFLEIADRNLKNRDYLIGNFSLADIAFAPWAFRFELYGISIPENLIHVSAWMKKLMTRNSVVKTRE